MLASDLKRIVIGVLCTIVLVLLGASSLMLFENIHFLNQSNLLISLM